ncbi:MAG: hypothetical protein ACM3PY_09230 [Omnitrophica WOR_2 bacterium]
MIKITPGFKIIAGSTGWSSVTWRIARLASNEETTWLKRPSQGRPTRYWSTWARRWKRARPSQS